MKKFALAIIMSCCLVVIPATVAAHELASTGTLSAVLHIEPDDHVVSGVASKYEIEFNDTAHVFKPADCDCSLEAELDGKTLATVHPKAVNDDTAAGTITFPKPGNYELHLEGQPKAGSNFADFDLHFPAAVQASKTSPSPVAYLLGAGALVAVVAIAASFVVRHAAQAKR